MEDDSKEENVRAPIAIPRPALTDHAPIFTDEIAMVPDVEDFPALLRAQILDTRALIGEFGEANAGLRYADGKWTVREVLGHLADCERVLSYRALRFIRGDTTVLQGFDQDAYVPAGRFEDRTMAEVLDEYEAVRHATVSLVEGSPPDAWATRGMVGKNGITSAALLYVIAGHERHHMSLLRTRYLPLAARG